MASQTLHIQEKGVGQEEVEDEMSAVMKKECCITEFPTKIYENLTPLGLRDSHITCECNLCVFEIMRRSYMDKQWIKVLCVQDKPSYGETTCNNDICPQKFDALPCYYYFKTEFPNLGDHYGYVYMSLCHKCYYKIPWYGMPNNFAPVYRPNRRHKIYLIDNRLVPTDILDHFHKGNSIACDLLHHTIPQNIKEEDEEDSD